MNLIERATVDFSATPRAWLDVDLQALIGENDDDEPAPPTRALRRTDLLADDAAELKAAHVQLGSEGTTPQAAATYLAGWYPGGVGRLLGTTLGTARAGLVLTPENVTFNVVEEGWPATITVGEVTVLVPPGHPWSGQPGVETVDETEMLVRTVGAAIEFSAPLVEACKGLAKVKRSSLWDELADGLACALGYKPRPIDPAAIDLLTRAIELPGTPWKGRPRLAHAESAVLGPVHVTQKGGCCLAFTCHGEDEDAEAELSERDQAWKERFPPEKKSYCGTCKFRDPEDSYARQVFWLEQEHADAS